MYRDNELFYRPYVLRMPDLGPTLQFERQQVPFTEVKVVFCLLQKRSLYFAIGSESDDVGCT